MENQQTSQINQQILIHVMGSKINYLVEQNIYLETRCLDLEKQVIELKEQLNNNKEKNENGD